jgi:hypothetical protein
MTVHSHLARPDWGVSLRAPRGLVVLGAGIGSLLIAAGGLVGWMLAGPLGAVLGVAGVAGVIAAGAAAQRRWLLARTGARPMGAGEAPRFINLVQGTAASQGASVPTAMMFDRPDPNAFVWGGRRPVIALSRGAVDGFTRTEIEAVVSHCFVRLTSGAGRVLPMAVLIGRLARRSGPLVTSTEDVVAVAATRYPPALKSAIEKCSPAEGALAPAFFVSDGWSHMPAADRMRALEDL